MTDLVVDVRGDKSGIDALDALRIAISKIISSSKITYKLELDKDSLIPMSAIPKGNGFLVVVGLKPGVELPLSWRGKSMVTIE